MIENGKKYKLKDSSYWREKYGTNTPEIVVEGLWKDIFGKSWMFANGNPAAMTYGMRAGFMGLPTDDNVYYGKIGMLGELVHESELEAIA
jgi:hypothetical protein